MQHIVACPDTHIAIDWTAVLSQEVAGYSEDTVGDTERRGDRADNESNLIETKHSTQTRFVMISAMLLSDE